VPTRAGLGDPSLTIAAARRVRDLLQDGLVVDEAGATRGLAPRGLAVPRSGRALDEQAAIRELLEVPAASLCANTQTRLSEPKEGNP
jgi:hypothetical protein